VVVLTDAIIGQMVEKLEVKTLDFGPLRKKDWALKGHRIKGPRIDMIHSAPGLLGSFHDILLTYENKWREVEENEVRYDTYKIEGADIVLVAYGYPSRVCMEVVDMARADGQKVGLFRPITLWPFPYEALKQEAARGPKFMVVEDSLGQMIEDVRLSVGCDRPIDFVGALQRHMPTAGGMIMPATVLEAVRKIA